MKNSITVVALLILMFGCSDIKKSTAAIETSTEESQRNTYLKAEIDGVDFYMEGPVYVSAYNIISLAALTEDKTEKIRIYINYDEGPATYTFGKGINNSDNLIYTNNETHWLAAKTMGEGSITIKEEGDYVMGAFSFIGVNKEDGSTKRITNGEFKVLNK